MFGYLLVLMICLVEVRVALRSLTQQIIRFLLFFCLGLIYGLVPLIGPKYNVDGYIPSQSARQLGPWILFLGTLSMAIVWHIVVHVSSTSKSRPLGEITQTDAFQRAARRIALVSAVIGVAGVLLNFKLTAGSVSAFLNSSRFQYRSNTGIGGTLALQMLVFLFVPPFLASVLRRRLERFVCVAFAIGMSLFEFIATSGDRSIPIGLIGSLALGWLITRRNGVAVSAAAVLALTAGALLAAGLYSVRTEIRHQSVLTTVGNLFQAKTYQSAVNTDPLNYNGEFLTMIDLFPAQHAYLNGAAYTRALLFPLPNNLSFGLKAPDTYVTIGNAIVPGSDISLPPSVPGDGWVNFWGAPGTIVTMTLWGALGAFADNRIRTRPWWAFFLVPELARIMALFVRGQPYETVVITVEIWAGMAIVARLCKLPPIWRLRPEQADPAEYPGAGYVTRTQTSRGGQGE